MQIVTSSKVEPTTSKEKWTTLLSTGKGVERCGSLAQVASTVEVRLMSIGRLATAAEMMQG